MVAIPFPGGIRQPSGLRERVVGYRGRGRDDNGVLDRRRCG
jgi:hypothetical protein